MDEYITKEAGDNDDESEISDSDNEDDEETK